MKKIGRHNIITFRFDSNETGSIICFDCENNIVMEITLPSDCIKIISIDDREYVHIKGDGIFTAHVHRNTYQKISDFFPDKQLN